MSRDVEILVSPSGDITFVHDDDVMEAFADDESSTRRASHVEPDGAGGWTADLAPVGGPVLGPFARRSDALAAELDWLREWLAAGGRQ